MNKQEILDWMQEKDEQDSRKRECNLLAEALCQALNIIPERRHLVLALKQSNCANNYRAISRWIEEQYGELDGLSVEEKLQDLQSRLFSLLDDFRV